MRRFPRRKLHGFRWAALALFLWLPQAGWAIQEITYGPWKSAVTNTTPDPLDGEHVAVIPLATGDELAARFVLNNAWWIQVSVFLETSPDFDLTQVSLSLQLRALQGGPTVPGTVIPGTTTPITIDDDEWRLLTEGAALPRPKQIYRTVGCDECRHTGYRGRLGIYEIMLMDEVLRERIARATDATALQQHALETGMVPLCVSGALKVSAGLTTPEEVLRVIQGKPEFKSEGQRSVGGGHGKAAQQRQADE